MISELPEGRDYVRLIDFGIAKIKASVVGTTTVSGVMAGTAAYMSPEQLRAEKITPASDIYALGIITFEMLTGRRPFTPQTIVQLSEMHKPGHGASFFLKTRPTPVSRKNSSESSQF